MEFDDKTVYIIDSYGLIFRCYFAFISRPLTNRNGENVSALFGFFRNLHFVLQHYKPGCLLAAMDSKTKTFRHEMYDQYKATRNKTPDDLHAQVPWICDILTSLGVPVLQCDGYEADDIIATVARKCQEQGRTCRILSGDKDLMQLVTESTQILKPESGASTWKITGIEGVEAEWGVKPAQLLDLLSLYGDTADNIPGVHGIGVKTASKLLNDYGDLDGIYAHIDEIKGANQKKLIEGKENAYFSRSLVKLCDTVPCSDIDAALASNISYNFDATAQALMSFDVPAVAKQYASLAVESGEGESLKQRSCLSLAPAGKPSSATPSNGGTPRNAPQGLSSEEPLPVKQNSGNYRALLTESELSSYIDAAIVAGTLAYDSETDSLDTISAKIIGFSLCYKAGEAVYVPLEKDDGDLFSAGQGLSKAFVFNQLKRLFDNPELTIVFHNAKFDLKVLASNGLFTSLTSIQAKIQDTMIAAWLQKPDRTGKSGYSLEYLGESELGLKGIEFDEIVKKGQTFADIDLETATPYAAEDADFTFQLWKKYEAAMKDSDLYNNIEMKILPILGDMELAGIHLDTDFLRQYSLELAQGIKDTEQNIYKEVGHEFNIASPMQLQTVLFEERGLTPGKKTKRGYSTDTSVLEELSYVDAVPRMILEYREMAKLQSTYVETLPTMADKNSRIHTDFIQTGTATGRLSSRDPNLQNIPVRSEAGRRIRTAFTAPEGKVLISADYAQIELVVLAHLSGDPNMCRSFIEGTDVHKSTAALIYGVAPEAVTPEMRRTAKTINFGVIYGMSAFRLARDLEISRTQASDFINSYFKMYAKINDFINETVSFAEENGFVETIFHRRRPILNINSKNKVEKSAAERIAVNTPVQGSAADIVKKAMLSVSEALRQSNSPARLLLQVHDELIFECPDEPAVIEQTVSLIKEKMENAVKLNVPLRVSIEYGKNWGEFH
ncbi:MAG: DNA polymerase I [Treponema sp.]|nr:DNA polymerase I [Treponema sp.]